MCFLVGIWVKLLFNNKKKNVVIFEVEDMTSTQRAWIRSSTKCLKYKCAHIPHCAVLEGESVTD